MGSDRRETGYLYLADEILIATVIEASTRGTHSSANTDDDDDDDDDDDYG